MKQRHLLLTSLIYLLFSLLNISCNIDSAVTTTEPPSRSPVTTPTPPSIGNNVISIGSTSKWVSKLSNTFIDIEGGTPPYNVELMGEGSIIPIHSSRWEFIAPSNLGLHSFKVTDSVGHQIIGEFNVISELALLPESIQLIVGQSISLIPYGGVPPYSLTVPANAGSVLLQNYQAPLTSGIYQLTILDSQSGHRNSITKTIQIFDDIEFSPSSPTLSPSENLLITTNGGIGSKTFSLISGPGSITPLGLFTAPTGAATSVIRVTDSRSNTKDLTLLTTGGFNIFPTTKTIYQNQTFQFQLSGGTPPYIFSISSGVGSVDSNGVFTSSSAGSTVLTATDSVGATQSASITTLPILSISAAQTTIPPNSSLQVTAQGGVSPYSYHIKTGGGEVHPINGLWISPAFPGSSIVEVTDSSGAHAELTLTTSSGPVLTAPDTRQIISGQIQLSATGGTTPYEFSILSGEGFINSTTGLFTAGNTQGSVVVKVTDHLGLTAQLQLSIFPTLTLNPSVSNLHYNESLAMSPAGGLPPYTFSILSGSGTLGSASGLFTAPSSGALTVVQVMDSQGTSASASLSLFSPPLLSPATAQLTINSTLALSVSGGIPPLQWSLLDGGGSIASNGIYTSPGFPTTARVQVKDSTNSVANAILQIQPSLSHTPSIIQTLTSSNYQLSPTGGVAPYTYEVLSGGGSVNSSGLFQAPSSTGSSVIQISDSLNNTFNFTINIISSVTISPTTLTMTTNSLNTFLASNGTPPYTFSVSHGLGSIGATSGNFIAPASGGNSTILVTDSTGATSIANIITQPNLLISESSANEGTDIQFTMSLSASSSLPILVNYATQDISAIAPTDYTSVNSSVLFNPGETQKTFLISTHLRTGYQGRRQFKVLLSSSDLTLTANHFVTATIEETSSLTANSTNVPVGVSAVTNLSITVNGSGLETYQYKLGSSASVDCTSSTGYSSRLLLSSILQTSISSLADGPIKLCLVGQDSQGSSQAYSMATSYTWIKYTSLTPIATLTGIPNSPSGSQFLDLTVGGTQVTHYQYKVGLSSTINCTSSVGYSLEFPISSRITDNISGLSDGNLTVCVIGKDALGQYQSYTNSSVYSFEKLTLQPTAIITSPTNPNIKTPTYSITITWNRPVSNFISTDITVTNGVISNWSGGPTTYTFTVTAQTQGVSSLSIAEGVCQDASANLNSAVPTFSRLFDSTPPSPPTNLSVGSPQSGITLSPTLTWTASSDTGVGVYLYEAQVHKSSDNSIIKSWTPLVSGSSIGGLVLTASTNYYFKLRAVDLLGNISNEVTSSAWLSGVMSGSWQSITTTGAPTGRDQFVKAWTSNLLMIFGGMSTSTSYSIAGGKFYEPATDTWTTMSTTGAPSTRHAAISSVVNNKLRIYGGTFSDASVSYNLADGAEFDPLTNTWSSLNTGAPYSRSNPISIWTGSEWIVWGGESSEPLANTNTGTTRTGGVYNPSTNTWRPTSLTNAPTARSQPNAVWTGTKMFIWGGNDGLGTLLTTGALYDPVNNTWTATSTTNAPSGRSSHSMIYDSINNKVIVLGGVSSSSVVQTTNKAYDPSTNTWSNFTPTGTYTHRYSHQAIFKNGKMYIYGGLDTSGNTLTDFPIYTSATNSWSMGNTGVPNSKTEHSLASSSSHAFIFSGNEGSGLSNQSGAIYDFELSKWISSNLTNAPTGRFSPLSIWTGSEYIIWGGYNPATSTPYNTGGRYNPSTQIWTALTTTNAPTARLEAEPLQIDSGMFIFGGLNSSYVPINNSKIFNYSTNSWLSISATNIPTARTQPGLVWTGNKVVLYGGTNASNAVENNGKIYTPSPTDSWTTLPTTSAPQFDSYRTVGVYLNSKAYFFGTALTDAGTSRFVGKYFDLDTNSWSATYTTSTNAPTAFPATSSILSISNSEFLFWNNTSNYFQIYNAQSNSWTNTSTTEFNLSGSKITYIQSKNEIFAWGGTLGIRGLVYNLSNQTWNQISYEGVPNSTTFPSMLEAGDDIVIYGGNIQSNPYGVSKYGAVYNTINNSWTAIDTFAAPTGVEFIKPVTDGHYLYFTESHSQYINQISRYDLYSQSWVSPIALNFSSRYNQASIYNPNQNEIIIWSGYSTAGYLATGIRFNLNTGEQEELSSGLEIRSTQYSNFAEQVGNYWVILGGQSTSFLTPKVQNLTDGTWFDGAPAPGNILTNSFQATAVDGKVFVLNSTTSYAMKAAAIYDPETNSWSTPNLLGSPEVRTGFVLTTDPTQKEVYVWGGSSTTGGIYNLSANTWRAINTSQAPQGRVLPQYTWTPQGLFINGGSGITTTDSYIYEPVSNTWIPQTTTNAPIGRLGAATFWTGSQVLIWGGVSNSNSSGVNTGGKLTP